MSSYTSTSTRGAATSSKKSVRKLLQVPSEEVKIVGGFTVDNDHTTTITLDSTPRARSSAWGMGMAVAGGRGNHREQHQFATLISRTLLDSWSFISAGVRTRAA
jgi:hypothetical protein